MKYIIFEQNERFTPVIFSEYAAFKDILLPVGASIRSCGFFDVLDSGEIDIPNEHRSEEIEIGPAADDGIYLESLLSELYALGSRSKYDAPKGMRKLIKQLKEYGKTK